MSLGYNTPLFSRSGQISKKILILKILVKNFDAHFVYVSQNGSDESSFKYVFEVSFFEIHAIGMS